MSAIPVPTPRERKTEATRQWRKRGRAGCTSWEIDEHDVESVCSGLMDQYVLTSQEREEVVRRLHARHMVDRKIAERTGMSRETVIRIRKRLELPPVPRQYWPRRAHKKLDPRREAA